MTEAASNPSSEGLGAQEAVDKIEALLGGQPEASAEETEQPVEAVAKDEQGTSETETPVEAVSDEDATPETEASQEQPESDEEDTAEAESQAEQMFTVRMGDKDVPVPLSELTQGYLRQSDYSRKTAEIAEQRKAADAELQNARQERQVYSQLLGQLEAVIKQNGGQEPDWEALKAQDVDAYWQARADWDEKARKLGAIQQEQARLQQINAMEQRKALTTHLDKASSWLGEVIPAWKDPATRKAEQVKLRDYGKKLGYSEEELNAAYDPRALATTWKAMKYDELMANKPKPATSQRGPQPLRPGQPSTQPTSKRAAIENGKKRLARTGRPADAVAVIEQLLS